MEGGDVSERTCGNCKHWERGGDIQLPLGWGLCMWDDYTKPAPVWVRPWSIAQDWKADDCPTWTEKEPENV